MMGTNAARLGRLNDGCVARESLRPDDAVLPERDSTIAAVLLSSNGVETWGSSWTEMPVPAAA